MTTEARPETLSVPERVATLEESHRHLATKEDMAELKSEIKEDNAQLRVETKEDLAELKAEIKQDNAQLRVETKNDLAELKSEIKEDNAQLRLETKDDNARSRDELKSEIAELKVLIERGQVNSTRWTVATIIAVGALIVAAVKFL